MVVECFFDVVVFVGEALDVGLGALEELCLVFEVVFGGGEGVVEGVCGLCLVDEGCLVGLELGGEVCDDAVAFVEVVVQVCDCSEVVFVFCGEFVDFLVRWSRFWLCRW